MVAWPLMREASRLLRGQQWCPRFIVERTKSAQSQIVLEAILRLGESMSLMVSVAKVPTRANSADAPFRGEVTHLDGDVRSPDAAVCDGISPLASATLT